jgi:hypothetical protein
MHVFITEPGKRKRRLAAPGNLHSETWTQLNSNTVPATTSTHPASIATGQRLRG